MKTFFKTALLSIMLTCVSLGASAQLKTSYFMEGSTFRYDMNPALTPNRGYFKLPGFAMANMELSNTLWSLDRFLYNKNGQTVTFMHNSVTTDEFLKKLNKDNYFGVDFGLPVFAVADYAKHYFWSFDLSVRMMGGLNVSRDFFKLIKSFGSNVNMGNTRFDINAYTQAALGFTFPLGEHVMFGFKVKGLLGLAHGTINMNDFGIAMNRDNVSLSGQLSADVCVPGLVWSGLGEPGNKFNIDLGLGDDGETRQAASEGNIETNGGATSEGAIDLNNLVQTTYNDIPTTVQNALNGGVAVDFGVEVNMLRDHLRVSASVVDLGCIWWNDANSASVETTKATLGFSGVNLSNLLNGGDFDVNKEITHNLNDLAVTNRGGNDLVTRLSTQLNVGVEYAFLRNRISVGLLSHNKFHESHTYSELTASVNFRPGKRQRFSATFSHSFLNSGLSSMGFAINFHPKGFNLFLGTDYIPLGFATKIPITDRFGLPIPGDTFGLSFYGGIAFSLHEAHFGMTIKEARRARRAAKNEAKLAKIDYNALR